MILYTTDRNRGKVAFWCCHLAAMSPAGNVKAGQTIGKVGATGTGANGPHLHFEIRRGHTTSWAGLDYNPIGQW